MSRQLPRRIQATGGDPVFRYVRGSRMRGAKFCDRCGASIRFPEDQPAALTVPAESRLIQEIKERFGI